MVKLCKRLIKGSTYGNKLGEQDGDWNEKSIRPQKTQRSSGW